MARAGVDFPDVFATNKHSQSAAMAFTSGNGYDPESLLTGGEVFADLGYGDKREWPDEATYLNTVGGNVPTWTIPLIAPRRRAQPC